MAGKPVKKVTQEGFSSKGSIRDRFPALAFYAVGILIFALWIHRPLFEPGAVLLTTDDNIGQVAGRHHLLPDAFFGSWRSTELLGNPIRLNVNWTFLKMWLLPPPAYVNLNHGINLCLASLFLGLYLRRRGVCWPAVAVGALVAFWLGSNFTLIFAGHVAKFSILMWAAVFLWLVELALASGRIWWTILAGGALGAMFAEQPDVGFFFALVLGPYALYGCWRVFRGNIRKSLSLLVPLFGVAFLAAVHPLWSGYTLFASEDITATSQDPEEKWNFLTQWSWPPEETIDFIAPGFMGWRSHEASGPYWGRMGRSAGWELTRQGFANFKLENQYVGAIPIVLAFWAAFAIWQFRGRWEEDHLDVLFWSVALLITFLLACGKYIEPLYRAFATLPVASSIRNPNKFLQIFQLALAILAAYGMDAVLGARRERWLTAISRRFRITFVSVTAALFGVTAFAWIGGALFGHVLAIRMESLGFGDRAVIAETMTRALGHATVMVALVSLVFFLFTIPKRRAPALLAFGTAWLLAFIVAADALYLSRHYVKVMNIEPIVNNRVAEWIKPRLGNQRVAFASTAGFYNGWLTYDFPYHHLPTINVAAAPRMGQDYRTFLARMGRNPLRMWALGAVGYILAPAEVWAGLAQNEATRDLFELQYAFNVKQAGPVSVRVTDATETQRGRHCLIRYKALAPRFVLVDRWIVETDDQVLQRLEDPAFQPFSRVFLSPDGNPPASPHLDNPAGIVGQVNVEEFKPGLVRLRVRTERQAVLRFSEKYHPGWTAEIDGKGVPVHRCDFIALGVIVPPGLHTLVFRYETSAPTFLLQLLGIAACGTAGLGLFLERRRNHR